MLQMFIFDDLTVKEYVCTVEIIIILTVLYKKVTF